MYGEVYERMEYGQQAVYWHNTEGGWIDVYRWDEFVKG